MDLSTFVPYYPESPSSEDITRRLEFNRHWADPVRDKALAMKTNATPSPFHHQMAIATFLLIYDRIFLYNMAGTGKTYTYLLAAELMRRAYLENKGSIKRVVILTPVAQDLMNQFQKLFPEHKKMPNYYAVMGYRKFTLSLKAGQYNDYDDIKTSPHH